MDTNKNFQINIFREVLLKYRPLDPDAYKKILELMNYFDRVDVGIDKFSRCKKGDRGQRHPIYVLKHGDYCVCGVYCSYDELKDNLKNYKCYYYSNKTDSSHNKKFWILDIKLSIECINECTTEKRIVEQWEQWGKLKLWK